jgi:hypothetical protein
MEELLKALGKFIPDPPRKIEFRVYYDPDSGEVLEYTTDPREGSFLVVSKDTFHENRFDVRIKDGKIIRIKPSLGKLIPAESGTPCDPQDVSIVIDDTPGAKKWKLHTYED